MNTYHQTIPKQYNLHALQHHLLQNESYPNNSALGRPANIYVPGPLNLITVSRRCQWFYIGQTHTTPNRDCSNPHVNFACKQQAPLDCAACKIFMAAEYSTTYTASHKR
jgi:hypothetical protein